MHETNKKTSRLMIVFSSQRSALEFRFNLKLSGAQHLWETVCQQAVLRRRSSTKIKAADLMSGTSRRASRFFIAFQILKHFRLKKKTSKLKAHVNLNSPNLTPMCVVVYKVDRTYNG